MKRREASRLDNDIDKLVLPLLGKANACFTCFGMFVSYFLKLCNTLGCKEVMIRHDNRFIFIFILFFIVLYLLKCRILWLLCLSKAYGLKLVIASNSCRKETIMYELNTVLTHIVTQYSHNVYKSKDQEKGFLSIKNYIFLLITGFKIVSQLVTNLIDSLHRELMHSR